MVASAGLDCHDAETQQRPVWAPEGDGHGARVVWGAAAPVGAPGAVEGLEDAGANAATVPQTQGHCRTHTWLAPPPGLKYKGIMVK